MIKNPNGEFSVRLQTVGFFMEETISGPCIENLNGEDLNELTHLKKNTDIDAVK